MAIDWQTRAVNGQYVIRVPPHVAAWDALSAWERERFESMAANLSPGDVLFDIGAEQGYLSVVYASFVGGASMCLFEPVPEVWPNIRLTWEANDLPPPLGCFAGLVSDRTDLEPEGCDSRFALAGEPPWPGAAQLPAMHTGVSYRLIWEHAGTTPQTTLDDWVAASGIVPDGLTIDVEGAELLVLRGAERTLAEHHPRVWVSIHEDMMDRFYGQDPFDLLRLMRSHRYLGEFLARDHESHWAFS